ncbi:MAG TPA: SRPBCC family protein [Woeseiaceae bacterium]|nr:SRPBCC family protein [Woeseiaceae bacterium]
MTKSALAAAVLLLATAGAPAADLRAISVVHENGRYHLKSEVWFAADSEAIWRVLTDFDDYERISSAFVDAYDVPPDEQGRPRFYTRMEGCLLFFCRSIERYGYLLLKPVEEIVAVTEPEQSDFKYCRERWQLQQDGEGTLLHYDFEMEPDFWVPPVIGPWIIKRTLEVDGRDAIGRIEAIARGETPKPVGE